MRRDPSSRRVSRRSLLNLAAAFAAGGLALVGAPSAFADESGDNGSDQGTETITVDLPAGVVAGQHWVDVNLTQQVACAMEGATIVRVILATTGQPGWETPEGQFLIKYRVADERMTSDALGIPRNSPDGYDLDHVLWTQYFTYQGHALHDNYWRPLSVFGQEATSHGCVGMVEEDARILWTWVGAGSLVNIHY